MAERNWLVVVSAALAGLILATAAQAAGPGMGSRGQGRGSQPGFRGGSPGFQQHFQGSFGFQNRFGRFDRVEDRFEAQLRRINPALFRRFDRVEDRFERQSPFRNSNSFRRFDRGEDRLEGQLRRADPRLFRQFDRFEDRLESRGFSGIGASPTGNGTSFRYLAYGEQP